jgi:hypothetical protein
MKDGSDQSSRRNSPWLGRGVLVCGLVVGVAGIIAVAFFLPRGQDWGNSGDGSDSDMAPVTISRPAGEWMRLDDPAAEGWDSEVVSKEIKKRLDALAQLIAGGQANEASLAPFVAADFSAGELVPETLATVYEKGDLTIVAGRGGDSTRHTGANGFAAALTVAAESLGSEGGGRRCAFKIVDIQLDGKMLTTQQQIEVVRRGSSGIGEQHAQWTIGWAASAEGAANWRMKSLVLGRFEQSTSRSQKPLFVDCTESALSGNASYRNQILRGANHWLPRIQDTRIMALLWTPGTALGDVNGDGLDDLYLCQAGGLPNRLFVQNADGSVRDATEDSATGWLESSRSALIVDFDNDGDRDLAVATYARVVVARNDGTGTFEVAAILEAGVGTMGLCAADFDNDGDLDLYAGTYSAGDIRFEAGATVIGSEGHFVYHDANNGGRNQLFRNDVSGGEGAPWKFTDVTAETGLDVNNTRFTLAAAWEDFDGDGDQDLYVANDYGRNNLYRNDVGKEPASRVFTDIAAEAAAEDQASGMSVSWGDVDRNGRMDLYIGNMFSAAGNRIANKGSFSPGATTEVRSALLRFARGNTMLLQTEQGFADVSEDAGVTMGRWSWSSMFADINNDGWDDLLVANGYITTPDEGDL